MSDKNARSARGSRRGGTAREVRELTNMGAKLLGAGMAAEAIPVLERAYEMDPDDVSVAINLGGAYIVTGQQRRAVPILERASELEPNNVMVWVNLGAAYLDRPPYTTREGQEKAILAYEHALQLDPWAHSVSYNLGLISKDREELEKAIEHFERAVWADPSDRDALNWYTTLKAELDRDRDEEGADDHA